LRRYHFDNLTYRWLIGQRQNLKAYGKTHVLEQLDTLLSQALENSANTQLVFKLLFNHVPESSTIGRRTQKDITERLLNKQFRALEREQIADALDLLEAWVHIEAPPNRAFHQIQQLLADDDPVGQSILLNWKLLLDYLQLYGVDRDSVIIQPNLARNWDYYTGVVFGIQAAEHQIAGGGRYDELARLLGGTSSVPAVGFAYYVDNILPSLGVKDNAKPIFRLTISRTGEVMGLRWAESLRQHNIAVRVIPLECQHEDEGPLMEVGEDGRLKFGKKLYTLETIDELLGDLREVAE
jgi:histidyl-tRNA synthetase